MWILIAILVLSVAINFDLLVKNHDIRKDMERTTWWKDHYRDQYHMVSRRNNELLDDVIELRKRVKKEKK
jgi:hypothetical protein